MIRVAVIGGGPKSLFALLALHDLLGSGPAIPIRVDVYDPLPPGSGSVWRADQPHVLRLNVNAGIVDASSTLSAESFAGWAARAAPEMSGEKYPPRAVVGRYLREQFQLLCQRGNFAVAHAPFVVTGVERHGSQWLVSGPFGQQHYDEVLVATGHGLGDAAPWQPLPGSLNTHPLIGDYSALTTEGVPTRSNVWIRGAALTAYDVVLLLTEGRGGSWQHCTNDGAEGTGVRYLPSGREPRRITLSSRSGLLLDPKSEAVPPEIAACLERYKPQLRQWGRQVRKDLPDGARLAGLWVVLLCCAQDCARLMGATVGALSLWRTAVTGLSADAECGPAAPARPCGAADNLRNSLAVNHHKAPVTTGWLWARVWSGLYTELVTAMDRLPRSTRENRRFARVAGNLERFAFGPPELTARKLLALFDDGLLTVAAAGESPPPDAVLIDAVTPGPGVLRAPAPEGRPSSDLFAGLLHAGHVSIRRGDRGLLADPDGTALASNGSRTESLAVVGRPTEGPTLGHDTLNRALHGEHLLWAQRIATLATDHPDTWSKDAPDDAWHRPVDRPA
ncbi:hypothetical protein ART_0390 [Arthrobacter sp. PAMC 25486]|uniref:FAD/NAD(P)-binding protein n=1 Tax=Arthrobacter sp. PAMC 25486 TaxID=1494608 RepID=UPI000535B708|nr:FAD/NAD(P)-binding domain-containing protein [Arthrobacter sp. PAMC 25486]AIX99988.1 hypothetical protein ART_0390 [Arthrobacter sp. PAMC 25486]